MNANSWMAAALALLGLTSCGDPPPEPTGSAAAPEETTGDTPDGDWKDQVKNLDWVKAGADKGKELAEKGKDLAAQGKDEIAEKTQMLAEKGRALTDQAKEALAKADLDGLKTKANDAMEAVRAGDYLKAEEISKKVDEALESHIVSKTTEFLRIQSEDGAGAATEKIDEYLAATELPPKVRDYFAGMKESMESVDKQEVEDAAVLLGIGVVIAADHFYAHGKGVYAADFIAQKVFGEQFGIFDENREIREDSELLERQVFDRMRRLAGQETGATVRESADPAPADPPPAASE